jgi:hypothetical protein
MDLLMWKVKRQFLCGLPSLSPGGASTRRPYFVTTPRNECWGEEEDENKKFVLQCQLRS